MLLQQESCSFSRINVSFGYRSVSLCMEIMSFMVNDRTKFDTESNLAKHFIVL